MKLVKENIKFERGQDPKKAMDVGLKIANLWRKVEETFQIFEKDVNSLLVGKKVFIKVTQIDYNYTCHNCTIIVNKVRSINRLNGRIEVEGTLLSCEDEESFLEKYTHNRIQFPIKSVVAIIDVNDDEIN